MPFPGDITVSTVVPGYEAVLNQAKLPVSTVSTSQQGNQHCQFKLFNTSIWLIIGFRANAFRWKEWAYRAWWKSYSFKNVCYERKHESNNCRVRLRYAFLISDILTILSIWTGFTLPQVIFPLSQLVLLLLFIGPSRCGRGYIWTH